MTEIKVPELGESITEATIAKWLREVGEHVEADEPLVDLETDKVAVQVTAPAAGAIKERKASEGDTVSVGSVIGSFEEGNEAGQGDSGGNGKAATAPEQAEEQGEREEIGDGRRLTPSQRRALRESRQIPSAPSAPPSPSHQEQRARPPASLLPRPSSGEGEEVVKMSPLRKRIAQRLVEAQQSAAILTTFNEVDMSRVIALRAEHKQEFIDTHGVKLGFMSFFVKAAIAALKDYPGLNAEIRDDSIVYKKYYNIGIAVGDGKGLVVPVLREADRMGFAAIEKTIADLGQRARAGTLKLDDLMGGTFTITNGGIYGSMMSTPLLNLPQTGILGMHNIVERPMAVSGGIEVRPMMYVALSYDHRVVDGREAVQFLVGVKQRIESPDRLMFEL